MKIAKSTQFPTSLDNWHGAAHVRRKCLFRNETEIHGRMVWAWRLLVASGQMTAVDIKDKKKC